VKVVSELQGKFEKAKGIIFTDFQGLTVEEIYQLRKGLRTSGLEYKVVKNTLARRAVEGTSVKNAVGLFSGPVGVAVGYDDPVLLAKKVLEFSRSNDKLKIKGGTIEGELCSFEDLKTISDLPSRDVQLSMLANVMQSPLSKLASLMNATLTQFVYALESLKQKRES